MFKEKSENKWNKRNGHFKRRQQPAKLPVYEKELKECLGSKGNHQNQKFGKDAIKQGGLF